MSTAECFEWGTADFAWNSNEYTWNDVCLAIEVATRSFGGAGSGVLGGFDSLSKEKKKQFITLILKVKGKSIEETKELKDYKVTADDIKLTLSEVLKTINVDVKK